MIATISKKIEIVIPREIRKMAGFQAGQKVGVLGFGGQVSIVPVPKLRDLQKQLKGMNAGGLRYKRDRF